MRYAGRAALAAMLTVLASGCGGPQAVHPENRVLSEEPGSSPSRATTVSPATPSAAGSSGAVRKPTVSPSIDRRPAGPPDFTDRDKPTAWIVGTVTAGGTGPCYGLVTDEGKQYALHSVAGLTLTKGSRVRVKTQPARVRIACGPGTLLEMNVAEPLR